jgi:serine/threonine protein kinase
LELTVDEFNLLPIEDRNKLIAFHGKAKSACGGNSGFSGEILFLDNGDDVHPRYIAAKFPKFRQNRDFGEQARRFVRELELQASAHYHPNVHWPFSTKLILGVPVAYFRRWEGDLANYIEEPSLGDLGRICLVVQIIAGLAHCLKRGLTFQDLKPENVFVRDLRKSFRGLPDTDLWLRPLVADFGSVNLAGEVGEFGGTRPYMAPEQWNKMPLGEWTTVFSVGVMLHELMSRGQHPIGVHGGEWHRGQNPAFNRWQNDRYWKRWTSDGCPISSPIGDSELNNLIAECLKVDPQQRPSLANVQGQLIAILTKRSLSAADQVQLFLDTAEEQTSSAEWTYLTSNLQSLRQAVEAEYPCLDLPA